MTRAVRGRCAALAAALAGVILLGACEKKEKQFDPPDREARVAQADSLYSPALFDSVTWETEEARAEEGNIVYAGECRDCHGTLGEGDTEYAASQGVDPPSLVEAEWEYSDDLEAIRRRIFVGHPGGMPTWGVANLTPREIDAAAYYINDILRPEVLGGSGGG